MPSVATKCQDQSLGEGDGTRMGLESHGQLEPGKLTWIYSDGNRHLSGIGMWAISSIYPQSISMSSKYKMSTSREVSSFGTCPISDSVVQWTE